jgi:hypothetical protein
VQRQFILFRSRTSHTYIFDFSNDFTWDWAKRTKLKMKPDLRSSPQELSAAMIWVCMSRGQIWSFGFQPFFLQPVVLLSVSVSESLQDEQPHRVLCAEA